VGLFSNVFGGNEGQKAFSDTLRKIRRILEDEQFQLEMLDPIFKQTLEGRPAYDRDPKGTGPFGFTETNPIPVNGPFGELAYLSKLETVRGERILFHRIGAIHEIGSDFPYDFIKMKQKEQNLRRSMAHYIANAKASKLIEDRMFQRPLAHTTKLELVKSGLTSFGLQ
jgi:hypothetical protein